MVKMPGVAPKAEVGPAWPIGSGSAAGSAGGHLTEAVLQRLVDLAEQLRPHAGV